MRLSLFTILAFAIAGGAHAAEIDLASRIDRVTVYPDAATVTRIAPVDLAAGASTLVLRGLPASVDPDAIRVEGEANAALAIGAADLRLVPGEARPVLDEALERNLREKREARDRILARIAAAEGKRQAIERYAQAGPEKLSAETKPLEIGQWASAWDAIGQGLASVHEELRGLRAGQRDLEAEIAALERARPRPGGAGAPRRDLAVAVEAGAALKGELRITYRVSGASWAPVYDARLSTGDKAREPALELVRRARVTQRTGEDWRGVALAVSTVRVERGAAAPDLPTLVAQFWEPPPRPQPLPRTSRTLDAARERAEAAPSAPAMAAPSEPKIATQEVSAEVQAGAFQASFSVPGRVDLAQDGSAKTFVIARREAKPALSVKAVPVLDETAYLEAAFVNEDETPLLPGEVLLHRDGAFIGKTRMGLVAPGDRLELGFGADDRVKVTRVPLRQRETDATWIGQTRTMQSEFKTTIRNLHDRAIRITLLDRVPVSEISTITVETLKETTPVTQKQPDDRRGVMAWSYDYAPGESRDIRFGYRMRWPADRDMVFEPKPVAAK